MGKVLRLSYIAKIIPKLLVEFFFFSIKVITIPLIIILLVYGVPLPHFYFETYEDVKILESAIINILFLFGFSYWIFEKYAKERKYLINMAIYFLILLFTIFPLNYMSLKNNRVSTSNKLQIEGYSMRGLSYLFLNENNQKRISKLYKTLPKNISYFLRLSDEVMYVFDLRNSVEASSECVQNYTKCSDAIFTNLDTNPRTSTYFILSTSVQSSFIFKDRETNINIKNSKYIAVSQLVDWTSTTALKLNESPYRVLDFENQIINKFNTKQPLAKVEELIDKTLSKCKADSCKNIIQPSIKKFQEAKRAISSTEGHSEET